MSPTTAAHKSQSSRLLSDLCPYCNETPPKYTCPACNARTCSLACSKRHKLFKQCSGTRDPTAYVRRSKLATPTALNRDYGFLTGVEKALTQQPLPVAAAAADDNNAGNGGTGERLQKSRLDRRGVVIKRAPVGFKRARENKTDMYIPCITKKQKVLGWTVEWILCDEENRRILDDRIPESTTIHDAFFSPQTADPSRKKEKTNPPPKKSKKTSFYILKPETPANRPVLIRLNEGKPLLDNLRGKTVMEYPTIYVTTNPESLQERYKLEEGPAPLRVVAGEKTKNKKGSSSGRKKSEIKSVESEGEAGKTDGLTGGAHTTQKLSIGHGGP